MFPSEAKLTLARVDPNDCYVTDYDHFSFEACKEYKDGLEANPNKDMDCIYVIDRPYKGKRYKIYNGRHRHLAYTMAKRAEIPVIILKLPY